MIIMMMKILKSHKTRRQREQAPQCKQMGHIGASLRQKSSVKHAQTFEKLIFRILKRY